MERSTDGGRSTGDLVGPVVFAFERQSEGMAKIYFGEREEEREREREREEERGRERKREWVRVGVYVPKLCTVYLLCCLSI